MDTRTGVRAAGDGGIGAVTDAERLALEIATALAMNQEVTRILERAIEPRRWWYPVGSLEYPVEQWYSASWHSLDGKLNGGYGHTGIDLNSQYPRGDADRGQPVYAIADGVVVNRGYSTKYLGSVVIAVSYRTKPLYVRYWHLANNATFRQWSSGDGVKGGEVIGHIGNYTLGGDHLHFDMAEDEFGPHWWFTKHRDVRWVDPLPVLRDMLDEATVNAMVSPYL